MNALVASFAAGYDRVWFSAFSRNKHSVLSWGRNDIIGANNCNKNDICPFDKKNRPHAKMLFFYLKFT